MSADFENNEEIKIFQEYLRIPSVHPNINYEPCVNFLKKQAESLNLEHKTIIVRDPKKPILLMTWKGSKPDLPAILLNSHMDVVPVYEEYWNYPPFGAEIHDGKIYARGTQDMKSIGIIYLGAIRALQKTGFKPERTIYLPYVPEEEVGSFDGVRDWVHTEDFKSLNIGFALDEGGANPGESFNVYFAERCSWKVKFVINGKGGHGLNLFKGTCAEKALALMGKLNDFRNGQIELIKGESTHSGKPTTINLTMLQGGLQSNIIPPQITLTYDMRIAIDVDHDAWVAQLEKWCEESGGGIEIKFLSKQPKVKPTTVDDSNEYWIAFRQGTDAAGIQVKASVCPGATDNRFYRSVGIPAFGFSPMNNTPFLLHDHDECVAAETFLRGIKIYSHILPKLTSLP